MTNGGCVVVVLFAVLVLVTGRVMPLKEEDITDSLRHKKKINNTKNNDVVEEGEESIDDELLLASCGSSTEICLVRMFGIDDETTGVGSHQYICDVVFEYGLSDTLMWIENPPMEAIDANRHLIAEESWFIRYKKEWLHLNSGHSCTITFPDDGDIVTVPKLDVRRLLVTSAATTLKDDVDSSDNYHASAAASFDYDYNHYLRTSMDSSSSLSSSSSLLLPLLSFLAAGESRRRRLVPTLGTRTFLIVIVNKENLIYSQAQIVNFLLGDMGSLKTQLSACSQCETVLEGLNPNYMLLTTQRNIASYDFLSVFAELSPQVKSRYGLAANAPLNQVADHVFFLVPSNIQHFGATGWAPVPGNFLGIREVWLSSIQNNMHEMGHNFGLQHGYEDDTEYGDLSTVMGGSRNVTFVCFNAAQWFAMEWFKDKHMNITDITPEGQLVDIAFFGNANFASAKDAPIYVMIEGSRRKLYLSFNFKSGPNQDTQEHGDSLIIVEYRASDSTATDLVGVLPMDGSGDPRVFQNFKNGNNLVVQVCSYNPRDSSTRTPHSVTVAIATTDGKCPSTVPPTEVTPEDEDEDELIEIKIDIMYDNNPQQVGWTLSNLLTDEVIAESSPGTVTTSGLTSQTVLVSHGMFDFIVQDTGGDGICCSQGEGWIEIYQVVNGAGKLYIGYSNGRFTSDAQLILQTWDFTWE